MIYEKECLECGKTFKKDKNVSKASWFGDKRRPKGVQFCSTGCARKYQSKLPVSEETRKRIGLSLKKAYKEGRKFGIQKGQRISPKTEFKKGENLKGEEATTGAKHDWIRYYHGRPIRCEQCGVTADEKIIDWSNKDHKYSRDIEDWQQLCRKCHRRYDLKHNKRKT